MHFRRPDLDAPTRLSLRECAWCAHRKILTPAGIRLAIRERRLKALPEICSGRHAAWGLVVPPYVVKQLIETGALKAQRVDDDNGRFKWAIAADDVRAIAKELEAEPSASDERRVEEIRQGEFEGRGGDPR